MIDVSLREALQRIKDECYIKAHCEDCALYWICPYLRKTEKPPCKWDVNAIVRGVGKKCMKKVIEHGNPLERNDGR